MALEDAIYLARTCEKVYLIHRRDSLRGAMVLQEELKSLPNVEILYDHVVTEICGEDMVEKLRIKNVKTEAEKRSGGSRHLYRCRHPSQHGTAAGNW